MFSVGIAIAGSAALGGYIVDRYGFQMLFVAAGIIATSASFLLLLLRKNMIARRHEEKTMPERHQVHR